MDESSFTSRELARFWAKVDRSGPCWIWTAGHTKGYGKFRCRGRDWRANRFAWTVMVGPIPEGVDVLHNCPGGDNRSCVNPAHLFLGTQIDNFRDALAKGQIDPEQIQRALVLGRRARFTPDIVPVLRRLHADGIAFAEIARRFDAPVSTVKHAVNGDTWKHVP